MSWREAVKAILDKDSLEREIINMIGLRILVYGILLLAASIILSCEKAPITPPAPPAAVQQPVRRSCTKRSCPLPQSVLKLSGEEPEQDTQSGK